MQSFEMRLGVISLDSRDSSVPQLANPRNQLFLKCRLQRTSFGFSARTVSLCSQSRIDAVKRMHRIGILCSLASSTQDLLTSRVAFVLSDQLSVSRESSAHESNWQFTYSHRATCS